MTRENIKPILQMAEDGESMLGVVFSPTVEGKLVYIFINIPLQKVDAFCDFIEKSDGSQFQIEDYGTVLAWGYGQPSDEVIAEMREKYGFDPDQILKIV